MKAVAITAEGAFIPADICAAIRQPLMRDLAQCRRDQIAVAPEIVDAVKTIDNVGASFENQRVSDVSSDVSPVESRRFAAVDFEVMTVPVAAEALSISQQAVRRLLFRQTLHGQQQADRSWRVCAQSVSARMKGTRCQH